MEETKYHLVGDAAEGFGPPGDSTFRLKKANFAYLGLFILAAILCFVLYNTDPKWISHIIKTNYEYPEHSADLAITLVARTSAAAAVFFLVHSLAMVCNSNLVDSCQFILHVSWPPLHYIIFIIAYAVFLFGVPDPFFDGFVKFAYGASAVYLVLQIVFLLDFFHDINEKFTATENFCALWTVTIVLDVLSLVGYAVGFWLFKDDRTSIIVLAVNLVVSLVLFAAAAYVERASIFTASLICAYTSFLSFSGCSCTNPIGKTDIIVSVVFSAIVLIWAGYSSFTTTAQFGTTCSTDDENERQFSLSFFHGVFALGSVYLTMLATNWAHSDANAWEVGKGEVSKWVNWATSWVTEALFVWILVAPYILTNRDFD
jgi:hypothetical protein